MGALVGHAKLAGNLGLSAALGEQVGGAQPSGLTGGTLILGLGQRVVDIAGPSHSSNPAVNPSSRRGGGLRVAVPGPGRASGAGLAAFGALTGWVVLAWMFGNPRRTRAGVRRPGAAGRSQRRRRSSANLRARRSWVWEAMASQGPAVGGLGGAELRAGPAQGLLEQSEGVLKIERTEKRLPPAVDVGGGGAGARRPQPPRLGVTVAGRVVDLQADQRALDDGQLAVVVQPAGPVGEPGMQPVPAAGHRGAAAARRRCSSRSAAFSSSALAKRQRNPPRPAGRAVCAPAATLDTRPKVTTVAPGAKTR